MLITLYRRVFLPTKHNNACLIVQLLDPINCAKVASEIYNNLKRCKMAQS